LSNARGRGGGLQLARAAREINVGAVVRMTEQGDMPAECFNPERNTCSITSSCRLKNVLRDAVKAFYETLDRYTVEDLVRNRPALAKVLFVSAASRPPGV